MGKAKDSKEITEIRAIEDKYGLVLFRMGLSQLMHTGCGNFDDAEVEATIAEITEQYERDRADGKLPVMTAEFQSNIIRCAAELTRFSVWTLFAYVKKYVNV